MLSETLDVVIGVDTHKDTHTAAAVAATGAVLDHLTVAAMANTGSDEESHRILHSLAIEHGVDGARHGSDRRLLASVTELM